MSKTYKKPVVAICLMEADSPLTMSLTGGTENPGNNIFLQTPENVFGGDETW